MLRSAHGVDLILHSGGAVTMMPDPPDTTDSPFCYTFALVAHVFIQFFFL